MVHTGKKVASRVLLEGQVHAAALARGLQALATPAMLTAVSTT